LALHKTSAVVAKEYLLLPCRRTAKFQVRQYQPFLVAQTDLDNLTSSSSSSSDAADSSGSSNNGNGSSSSSGMRGINPASAGMKSFNALANYIFGGNASSTKMAMTTPVFTSTDGTMQFVVDTKGQQVSFLVCNCFG
jgi:hypothetical protein